MRLSLTSRILLPFLALTGIAFALLVWAAAAGARRAVEERALQQAREMARLFARSGFLLNPGMLGHVKSAADADIVDVSGGRVRGSTLSREEAESVAKAADPKRPFAEAGRFRVVQVVEGDVTLVFAYEAAKLEAAKSAAARPLLLMAAGSFLGVFVLGVAIGRALLKPVGALLAGAERVSSGDTATDVVVTTGDELQRLAEAFNRMLAALRRQREDERWASAGRVAAGVAHDLRNPLTGMLMMLQMLEREERDGRKREVLQRMLTEARRMERSLQELMALASPEPARRERVDLGALVKESISLFEAQAAHRGVALAAAGEAPAAMADGGRVRRVVDNLVANALDATPAKGRVTVALAGHNGRAEVRVEDTGPGIPEDVRARLFEPFTSSRPGGTGLGLASVKRLADEMGAEVRVDSGAGGTAVTVLFPVA